MNEKLNHTNLCMDEISSFVEKIRFVFIVEKKKMILICQNIKSALWDVKKKFCDDKNSDLFCYVFKKKIF